MTPAIKRVIGETYDPAASKDVQGFVAVHPTGELAKGKSDQIVLFSANKALLQHSLPPGIVRIVPATLVVHNDLEHTVN